MTRYGLSWKRGDGTRMQDCGRQRSMRLLRLDLGWREVEVELAPPLHDSLVVDDGVARGWIGAAFAQISRPSHGFGELEEVVRKGNERWLVGAGSRLHPMVLGEAAIGVVRDMRLLLARERSCRGVVVGVRYDGWTEELEGADEHYLKMVEFGSRRDPRLSPYYELGFWTVGKATGERIAYLARSF